MGVLHFPASVTVCNQESQKRRHNALPCLIYRNKMDAIFRKITFSSCKMISYSSYITQNHAINTRALEVFVYEAYV